MRHLQYTYYKKPKNSFLLSHSYKKGLLIFFNFTHAKAHLLSAILTQFFDWFIAFTFRDKLQGQRGPFMF